MKSTRAAVLALALAATAAAPELKTPPQPKSVLYLSALSPAADHQNLHQLWAAVSTQKARVGPVHLVATNLADLRNDLPSLRSHVLRLMRAQRWDLIYGSTMQMAQTVALAAPAQAVVFNGAADPVRMCLVDSLARPGRQATGYTAYIPASRKMMEALLDAFPAITETVILVDGVPEPEEPCPRVSPAQARSGGREAQPCKAGPIDQAPSKDIQQAVSDGMKGRVRMRLVALCGAADIDALRSLLGPIHPGMALLVPTQYLFVSEAQRVVKAINGLRLPAIYPRHSYLAQGGLMSLAPTTQFPGGGRAVELAARVLAGESPSRLPVQTPEGFELRINLAAARGMGLSPSRTAWYRAERVVQ